MKNIFIVDEFASSQKNGIGTFIGELLYCLKHGNYKINMIVFNANVDEFCVTEDSSLKRYLFPTFKDGYFLDNFKIIEKFFRLYIQDSPNNIFFVNHSPCADFIESLKHVLPNSRVVFTVHDFAWTRSLLGDIDKYKELIMHRTNKEQDSTPEVIFYCQEKRLYDSADNIICLSSDTYGILQSVYNISKSKMSLIPNGLRPQFEKMLTPSEIRQIKKQKNIDDYKVILFIGRLTRQKGAFDIIHAMEKVLKRKSNVKLVFVGDVDEVSMRKIINASSTISSSVVYTGHLERDEVKCWLSIADIGVIPSYYEQCSYTAIEMMMSGIPIIASNGMGLRNMFQNRVDALVAEIYDSDNTEAFVSNLSSAILELLDSNGMCRTLGLNAIKKYESEFTIEQMKKKYLSFIDTL